MSQKLDLVCEQCTLGAFDMKPRFSQPLEHKVHMFPMLSLILTKDQDIIKIYKDAHIYQVGKHQIHSALKMSRGIFQPKLHDTKLKGPVPTIECRLMAVLRLNGNLMVAIPKVQFRKHTGTLEPREQLIYTWQRELVSNGVGIKAAVVGTHSQALPTLFCSKQNRGTIG